MAEDAADTVVETANPLAATRVPDQGPAYVAIIPMAWFDQREKSNRPHADDGL